MVLQDNGNLDQLFQKGKLANESANFEEALKIYETIVKDDPNCIEAWNNLGVALCELDQYRKALDAYSIIKENQRKAKTWYNISFAYYNLRDFEQALNCIQEALKIDSYDSTAWDLKGKIQVEQEDYQNAMMSFNLAFSTNGDPKFLLWDAYSLYLYLEFTKDIDERTQRKLLNTLIRRLEKITHHHYKHATANSFGNRRRGLIPRNRSSTPQNHFNSNLYCDICQQSLYYLGCAYSRYRDYSTAIDRLEQCIQENPNSHVTQAARSLLEQNWSQIRPSLLKWWFQSSPYLNRRMKKVIAVSALILLVLMIIFFLLHPLFRLKDKVEWNIYLFVASLLLIFLLSPGVEQIKAKDVEIKIHASTPFDPFPSPAKMEDDIGAMSKNK